MKIDNLKSEKNGNRARVAATVTWEDCERATHEVYFETEEAFARDLTCNAHAFLIACIIPAMHYGEKRVSIDAEICPELREGLITAMSWLRHWFFQPDKKLVRIEAREQSGLLNLRKPERAGFFFSGGVDSFATLRANHLNFPEHHPRYIKDGLLVFGFEQANPQPFEYLRLSLSNAARDAGITLIPVYTNIFLHYWDEDIKNEFNFWTYEYMGAALASVAHAFVNRLSVVSINADYDIPNQRPLSSHPLVDPNYSSSDLRIRHDGITLSRYERTKLIVDWDVALQHLRVCNHSKRYQPDMLNCGKCEKCVRTMLALVALNSLDKTTAFPYNDLDKKILQSYLKLSRTTFPLYTELIQPLLEKGRYDLVRVIERKLSEFYKHQKMEDWKALIRKFSKKKFYRNFFRKTNDSFFENKIT